MKKSGVLLLGFVLALPVHAQDTWTPKEEAPPSDASAPPPADASATPPADASATAPADASATPPADASATPTTDASATPPADASATPTTDASATPPADASATPTTDASATPPADASATPTADASTTPATDASTAPPSDSAATLTDTTATPPAEGTATDAAPVETTAEAPPADAAPADASVDATATADATTTVDAAPAAEETPAEEANPWIFYVGASYGSAKLSISNLSGLEQTDTTTIMYQGRVGMRITNGIGLEAHYGQGQDDDNPYQAKVNRSYGIYIVPTGTLLDMVEFAFPLGFAWTKVSGYSVGQGSGAPPAGTKVSQSLDGVSYGMNVEFPFKLLMESIPDIRLTGGGMVYQQNNSARTYGWHAGLRFDFAI